MNTGPISFKGSGTCYLGMKRSGMRMSELLKGDGCRIMEKNRDGSGKMAGVHYSVIQGFFWIAYCAGVGFSSTYLLEIGFKNSEIGILIALSGVLAAVLQPSLAGKIDRSGKKLLKPVIFGGIVAAVGLSGLILLLPSGLWAVCGICFAGNLTVLQLLIPLVNSLSICGKGSNWINFGFSRAIGSLTYAAASYLLGMLVSGMGMEVLAGVRIVAFLALAGSIVAFPVRFTEVQQPKMQKNSHKEGFFSRYPGFRIMMAGCFLIYLCHSFLTYYNYQIVLTKGGDEKTYGIVIALAAIMELPVMFGFAAMQKKKKAAFWFRLSGLGYFLKALTAYLAVNMMTYYLVQVFQMMAWAMITVASVCFVKDITREEDSTSGQAYLTLSYTCAMAVGSLSGGFLLQLVGVNTMLILAILFAAAGSFVLYAGIRKTGRAISSI